MPDMSTNPIVASPSHQAPTPPATTLCVASVQIACELGDIEGNLRRATTFLEDAVRQGAKLVLMPEMMPGGYTLSERIWDTAEPFDGPTTSWLRELCRRQNVYIGTT